MLYGVHINANANIVTLCLLFPQNLATQSFAGALKVEKFLLSVFQRLLSFLRRSDRRLIAHNFPPKIVFSIFTPRRRRRDYLLLLNSCPHFNKDTRLEKVMVWLKNSLIFHLRINPSILTRTQNLKSSGCNNKFLA